MTSSNITQLETTLQHECTEALLPVRDALEVLSGPWKLPILITLSDGPKRFKQISKELTPITDKMLSRELKDLEANNLIVRTLHETFPLRVEYKLTEYSQSLASVIAALKEWGLIHRKTIIR